LSGGCLVVVWWLSGGCHGGCLVKYVEKSHRKLETKYKGLLTKYNL
jgi:hypothetical protein